MRKILPDLRENDTSILLRSSVMFYSPLNKLAIDIAEINTIKNKNANKMKSLAFHGIEYILFFPSEVNRNDTICSYILDKISPDKTYSDFIIKRITEADYRKFAKMNSFRTLGRPSINYGFFVNNVLYFTLSLRKQLGNYELINFVRKNGEVSTSAFKAMFEYFLIEYKPKSIAYFIDRRIDRYDYLLKLGFSVIEFGYPRWYLISGDTQVRDTNKYIGDKIWDCGTIKLQWKH